MENGEAGGRGEIEKGSMNMTDTIERNRKRDQKVGQFSLYSENNSHFDRLQDVRHGDVM